jgi:hypothetical protein
MQASVQFYRKVLGMELLYGGEQAGFSSLRANDSESAILNLEQGYAVSRSGRLIFHVTDVDAFWIHLKERGVAFNFKWRWISEFLMGCLLRPFSYKPLPAAYRRRTIPLIILKATARMVAVSRPEIGISGKAPTVSKSGI